MLDCEGKFNPKSLHLREKMHQIYLRQKTDPMKINNFTYSCFLTFTKLDEHQASYGIFFVS